MVKKVNKDVQLIAREGHSRGVIGHFMVKNTI